MNSSSDSSALIFCGERHTSKSMLPPPSWPGYDVTFPSNLLPYPLLAATAFPIPNSFAYTLNLGELPNTTQYGSNKRPSLNMKGDCSHSCRNCITSPPLWFATVTCNFHAVHPKSFSTNSPALVSTLSE
uniref:Uncharacterized protein n=1 Tax=Cajanus cajan TaxID=3821 RepID=A0A151RI57_CAJCA|nr:hypothetical protein KK1_036345 [Cajanus cajan]